MMKELTKIVGLKFKLSPFEIEKGKIKEFAMTFGDENPIYYDKQAALDSGFRDIPIPPTFATVIDIWAGLSFDQINDLLGLDQSRVLHGEQAYEYVGDICTGDIITGEGNIVSAVKKKNLDLITLETTYKNQVNEVVLKSRCVIIERQNVL
jgi:acyl dehydratase